jgi:biopolymer transport protein ExbD
LIYSGSQLPETIPAESFSRHAFKEQASTREISIPRLIFVPSGSYRKCLRLVGEALILLAVLLYAGLRHFNLISGIFAAVGLALMVWPEVAEIDELRLQGEARATFRPKGGRRYPLPLQAVLTKPFSSLLTSSLCIAIVFLLFLYPFMIASLPTPMGFNIYIPKPGTLVSFKQSWSEPLVLCVSESHFWYLNGLQVPQSDVERRLGDFLRVRGDKTVFVDAAGSNPYYLTVAAIAEVEKVPGAKVILVTPDIIDEVPNLVGSSPCETLTPQSSRSH